MLQRNFEKDRSLRNGEKYTGLEKKMLREEETKVEEN